LEGIVTTVNADGSANVAPMGPVVDDAMTRLLLRPYQTSTTYKNLKRSGEGVLHVTDDVEMIARAAVGELPAPRLISAERVKGYIVADACRWYEFRVARLDDSRPRTEIEAEVAGRGRLRDFFGFNRAMHAVLEAAILATRIEFLPAQEVRDELERLAAPVEKTAGEPEQRAFDFLRQYVQERLAGDGNQR
jgi:hypothetical protein